MNKCCTMQVPKDYFTKIINMHENNLENSANHLERLRLMIAEFKELNRQAKDTFSLQEKSFKKELSQVENSILNI